MTQHYQELTSQFMDRELGAEEEAELFAHLGTCAECRDFLKEALRLQADLALSKFKAVMTKPAAMSQPQAPDQPPLAGAAHQGRFTRLRTAALLVIVVLVAGLFWSTTLMRQNPEHSDLSRQVSASEIPNYQP